jgi:hypothetical protein
LTATAQTDNRIHQDVKGRLPQLTTGVAQRQTPLHPTVAFVAGSAMGALTPQHLKAQRPLGAVVGRFNAMLPKKHPQRRHLTLQPSGQATGLIGALMVTLEPGAKPRILGPPLATCGWSFGHLAQALQLLQGPRSTGRKLWRASFGQAPGGTNQMGQTRLALVHLLCSLSTATV